MTSTFDQRPRRPSPASGRWFVALVVLGTVAAIIVVPKALAHRKVLAMGDSLTAQSTSVLVAALQAKGFDPEINAISGSGLIDTEKNWPSMATSLVKSFDPDIVVVESIGDYGLFGMPPGVVDRSPAFYERWAAAAQELEQVLTSQGAQVYWVIGPPVAQAPGEQKIVEIDHIYQSFRAPNTTTGHPLTIDELTPFSAPGGGYTQFVPGPGGTPVQVRPADGTHFTEAGIERYVTAIVNTIGAGPSRSVWRL